AQQKMHCAVRSTYTDNQKFFEGGKFYSLNKSFEKDNFRASLEDSEIASLNSRNSDNSDINPGRGIDFLQKSKMFEAGYPFSNPLNFMTETSDRVSNVNSLTDVKVSLL
ncbi:hypothetical protein CISIN_1g0421211mg, partial [Citrus sinensis]